MSKPWNPNRPTVELRVSKIRREPPPPPTPTPTLTPEDSERETWILAIGILAFALAITILIFWISDFTQPAARAAVSF